MKTNLDKISKSIYQFEKKAHFDKTSKKKLVKWLAEEVKNYKKAKTLSIKSNKLADIICLVMQIARREHISLDKALKKWFLNSRKYLIKSKKKKQ